MPSTPVNNHGPYPSLTRSKYFPRGFSYYSDAELLSEGRPHNLLTKGERAAITLELRTRQGAYKTKSPALIRAQKINGALRATMGAGGMIGFAKQVLYVELSKASSHPESADGMPALAVYALRIATERLVDAQKKLQEAEAELRHYNIIIKNSTT